MALPGTRPRVARKTMSAYRLTVSGLVFMGVSCVAATLAGSLVGRLSPVLAMLAFLTAFPVALWTWQCVSPGRIPRFSNIERLTILVFVLACLRSFLWLVFLDGDQLKVLSRNNLGDLSLHWHYIVHMANNSFWPQNPILPGTTIRYPIGIDLFNSLLLLCGVDLMRGLIWVGLAGSFFTLCALLRWGRAFAVAGLLFNGGIAGFLFLGNGLLKDYQAALAWKNLFLSIFVTQRGFLYALPAGLLLLDSWRNRANQERPPLSFWIEWFLYASLPLFHFHTFLFLSLVLGSWALFGVSTLRLHVFKLGAAAIMPATWLTLLVTENFKGSRVITFRPGWMQGNDSFLLFWVGNFGLWLLLFLLLAITLFFKGEKTARVFVFPALAAFILCAFFLFAPWEWDNTKLLLWSYMASLPFIWSHLLKSLPIWLRALACFGMFFSGAVSLIGGLSEPGFTIAQRSESDELVRPLEKIPSDACFAAAPEYNHPLVYLGRAMAMGYPGHMFGHGLPYTETERDLARLMMGAPSWKEAAQRLKIDYIFWGPREKQAYGASTKAWTSQAEVVASGVWGNIYRLNPSATGWEGKPPTKPAVNAQ